jgi:hypothetical protein
MYMPPPLFAACLSTEPHKDRRGGEAYGIAVVDRAVALAARFGRKEDREVFVPQTCLRKLQP